MWGVVRLIQKPEKKSRKHLCKARVTPRRQETKEKRVCEIPNFSPETFKIINKPSVKKELTDI